MGRDADEGAGEAAMGLVAAAFIREQRRVEHRADGGELAPLQPIEELQRAAADAQRQADLAGLGDGHRGGREGEVAIRPAHFRAHDQQFALAVRMGRHCQIEEVVAAVIGRQPRHGAFIGGGKIHRGFGIIGEVLLPAGDQRLLEPGAGGFTAEQAEFVVCQCEDPLGLGRAQPLEVQRQALVETIALLGPIGRVVARAGHLDMQGRHGAVFHVNPVVIAPIGFLDGRLAAQHAAALLGGRATGEMHEEGLAVGRFHQVAMAGALQRRKRGVLGGQDILVGMGLVGAVDSARAREGAGMVIGRAAFCGQQIIPGRAVLALALVEMGALDQLEVGALIDVLDRPDELAGLGVEFLQRDAGEQQGPAAMVPQHVDEPFAAIVIVEQARVKARGIHVDRIAPGPLDAVGPDDVIMRVLERAVLALDVGIDQPEFFAVMAEAGRPDAAAVGIAAHVELALARQRPGQQRPVGKVLAVMDLHAGEPFEGRGGDVIVLAHPQDRRVGVEAGQDGIGNLGHGGFPLGALTIATTTARHPRA